MATKVIKLQDSNDNILIPVTDASVVQMSVEGQVKSVKDVIIENEEVTAAGYNNLNSRVIALEESPGIDKVGTITDVRVNNSTVVSNGVANIQLTGADILLEHGAGQTINEAVNSNTEALQNKLDAANGVFLLQHDTSTHIERFVVPEYWAANAQQGTCCGVVVQVAGKIYVLAPVQVSLPWATSPQLVGAAVSNYFDAMLDLDGKAKTAAIVSRYGSGTGYAAGYCNAYGNDAIEAGKWWLGSAGEWIEIGAMRAGVLKAYEVLGMSFGGSQNSSTEYSSSNFWYAQAMLDWCQQISRWQSKTSAGPTTPITRLR